MVSEDRAKKVVQEMMDHVLQNRNELETECKSLKLLNEILKSQRYDALALLDRLEQEKRAAEVEQFSKFVFVLNAKKAKIVELRQQLNREQLQRASALSQLTRSSQTPQGAEASRAGSLQPPPDPLLSDTFDPLDVHYDSHEVYSLSTTSHLSRRKSDLILEGRLKEVVAATSRASPSKPQNLFDLHTPSSLAMTSSSLKRQSSQQSQPLGRHQTMPSHDTRALNTKRPARLDDILAMDDSDEDTFLLPEPKKWKH